MLVMLIAFLVAASALVCICVPSVWSALMAIDEPSDPHELGLVVASRTSYATPSPSNAYMFSLDIQETLSLKVDLRHARPSLS